jgi:hypothetical protein
MLTQEALIFASADCASSALSGAHPFLAFAHLAFCAAAIRARPSALIFLRGALVVVVAFEAIGRPRFTGAV